MDDLRLKKVPRATLGGQILSVRIANRVAQKKSRARRKPLPYIRPKIFRSPLNQILSVFLRLGSG